MHVHPWFFKKNSIPMSGVDNRGRGIWGGGGGKAYGRFLCFPFSFVVYLTLFLKGSILFKIGETSLVK